MVLASAPEPGFSRRCARRSSVLSTLQGLLQRDRDASSRVRELNATSLLRIHRLLARRRRSVGRTIRLTPALVPRGGSSCLAARKKKEHAARRPRLLGPERRSHGTALADRCRLRSAAAFTMTCAGPFGVEAAVWCFGGPGAPGHRGGGLMTAYSGHEEKRPLTSGDRGHNKTRLPCEVGNA